MLSAVTFQSFAHDIEELLNSLHLDKVIQVGTSGGGPYAAACAYYLPTRTSALGLIASMTPTSGPESIPLLKNIHWSNVLSYKAINSIPWAVRLALLASWPAMWAAPMVLSPLSGLAAKYPSSYLAEPLSYLLATGFSDVDRRLMSERPELTWRLGSYVVSEAVAGGTQGLMRDMVLTSNGPWEFDPAEIQTGQTPAVVFQGAADVCVSVEMAKWWEGKLPGCTAKYFEGEGHLTVVANHAAEIVGMLGEAATAVSNSSSNGSRRQQQQQQPATIAATAAAGRNEGR